MLQKIKLALQNPFFTSRLTRDQSVVTMLLKIKLAVQNPFFTSRLTREQGDMLTIITKTCTIKISIGDAFKRG